MRKFLLSFIAVTAMTLNAVAQDSQVVTTVEETENGRIETTVSQDKYKVETNRFWNNWFISANGGAQVFLGDLDKYMKFGDRVVPAIDVTIGKWFTPSIGVGVSYSGFKVKGAYNDALLGQRWRTNDLASLRKTYPGGGTLYEQNASFFDFHADVLFNISNMLCGYNPKRFYNFIPTLGAGYFHSYDHDGDKANYLSFHAGIINKFRLSSRWDLDLTIRGTIFDDGVDGEVSGKQVSANQTWTPGDEKKNIDFDGFAGVTLGLTYRIGKQGWGMSKSVREYYVDNTEINRLNKEVDRLIKENEALRNRKYETGKEIITFPYLVNFKIDKTNVQNRELVNLKTVADMMKATPEKKYNVVGYADKYTGSVKRNDYLAKNRAKNVFRVLTEEFGVPASQLVLDDKGGVENMFYDDPQLSRSVIISEVK